MAKHIRQEDARSPRSDLLHQVADLLRARELELVRDMLGGLPPADVAEVLENLDEEHGAQVFRLLESETAGAVLGEVGEIAVEHLADSAPESVARAIEEMAPDEMADVLEVLPEEQRDSVLQALPREEAREVEELLAHAPDTAGGIMTPDFLLLAGDISAAQAVSVLQKSRESETIAHLFVSDRTNRLLGHLPLHRLVFARPERRLSELLDPETFSVAPQTDQEEVVRLATKYNLQAVPVVDERGEMIGVITVDDIMEAAQEEANEDMYRLAGTGERDPVHAGVLRSTRLRLPWLVLTLLGGSVIAFTVSRFEGALEATGKLAFFIPIIPLMGGNVALQASTIVVRGLAVGDIGRGRIAAFVGKQWLVTAVLALSCGLLAGVLGYLMPGIEPRLALTVGIAVTLAISMAGTLGTVLPLAFDRLGMDPAVSAGPFVTILNDIFCIAIYLALGTVLVARA